MGGMAIPTPPVGARAGVGASRTRQVDLAITGMTGPACAARIERALGRSPGVLNVSIDLVAARASVSVGTDAAEDDGALGARLRAAVGEAGYGASVLQRDPAAGLLAAARERDRREARELMAASALTLPLLVSMLAHLLFSLAGQPGLAGRSLLPAWLQLLLATPVLFGPGWRLLREAAEAASRREIPATVLAALAATSAWLLSMALLLRGAGQTYGGIAALIVTCMLAGRWLERRAQRTTSEAVRALAALAPSTVIRLDADTGAEHERPASELAAGDLLVVQPGSRIAADGVVRQGESGIDESLITGEIGASIRGRGDHVIAGALAVDGRLVIEALATGADTRLARIVRSIEIAQAAPAPVRRLVDRLSALAVPAAAGLAILAVLWRLQQGDGSGRAVMDGLAVLMLACPGALGLATAGVLVGGVAAAARAGILIRDIGAIERARDVGIVAFDKTGTLTVGRPVLSRMVPASGATHYAEAAELLSLAAAMQRGSDHPLAQAVRDASGHSAVETAERFAVVPGRGVLARIGGRSLMLGNRLMLEGDGVGLPASLAEEADQVDLEGGTVSVLVERRTMSAGGSRVLGLLCFSDALRPGAREAVARLSQRGIMSVMLTGDGEGAGRRIATAAGIDRMLASVSPEEKARAILVLRDEVRQTATSRVAMVGDGINDAAALAAADLGIAMGGATDAAVEAAGVTLMRNDPMLVADGIDIAARIATRIRFGLAWTCLFNLLVLPFALAGRLVPDLTVAAALLGLAAVGLNALGVRGWRPEGTAAGGAPDGGPGNGLGAGKGGGPDVVPGGAPAPEQTGAAAGAAASQ